MMIDNFGTVLATRKFTWIDDLQITRYTFVDISLPVPLDNSNGSTWVCNIRTRDSGEDSMEDVWGSDSIQAVELAIVHAGVMVNCLTIARHFDYAQLDNYGFPKPASLVPGGGGCGCHGN
jgi:hypothetical protein